MIREAIIERSEGVLGGTAVFKNTRVPVQTLLDYLQAGDRLDDFLLDFPAVTRERAPQARVLAMEVRLSDGREGVRGSKKVALVEPSNRQW